MSTGGYDIVVIGAGHNGLTAAAYLARAKLRTLVVERRPVVGGCVVTEEIFPGYRINTASFEHVQIHWTPVLEELDLARFGLEYLEPDPAYLMILPEGRSLPIYRDVERTAEALALRSGRDARAYREFHAFAQDVLAIVRPAYLAAPTPWGLVRRTAPAIVRRLDRVLRSSWLGQLLRVTTSTCRQLVERLFETPEARLALALSPISAGLSPSAPGSAFMCLFHDLVHETGVKRPRGGSGMLTQALRRHLEHSGGTVLTGGAVTAIETERGAVRGVRLRDGTVIEARAVLSAIDPRTTLLSLLAPTDLPPRVLVAARAIRVANGVSFKVDCSLRELPRYRLGSAADAGGAAVPMQFIAPSVEGVEAAYAEYAAGRVPREPALMVATHTALDPSLAPPGRHTLLLETRYTPYRLRDGTAWTQLREAEADRLLALLARYAPNLAAAVDRRFIQSPEDMEARFALPSGHQNHCDMSADQMVLRRPLWACAAYRTPIRGCYLTGAGTHPGGGVSGAPGRNAAMVMLRDLGADT